MLAVTVLMLHPSALDKRTDCNVVVESREQYFLCLQLLQYSYIHLLWIKELTAILLVQSREESVVMTAATAVFLYQCVIDPGAYFSVVSKI